MTTTTECIFCNMAQDPMHSEPVYRDDRVFAVRDINPKAPVHMLIIPNIHIASLAYVGPGQVPIMGHMFVVAEEIARRDPVRGEIVIAIARAEDAGVDDEDSLRAALLEVRQRVSAGTSPSRAAREVAAEFGVSRRLLYARAHGDREES